MNGSNFPVLGIFAKQPALGNVKTRLAAETSPGFAAALAEALLRDTLERCRVLAARRFLAFAPDSGQDYFAALAGAEYALAPQGPGDLGERMARFLAGHLPFGQRVVLLGTDSPTLPLEIVRQAFTELDKADVVVGPATDGGYYLLGCKGKAPPIFEGMAWGGANVLRDTVRRLEGTGFRFRLLPPWYDVDTLVDLQMLRGHVEAMRQTGADPGTPHLDSLFKQDH